METKTTSTVEETYNLDDLKSYLIRDKGKNARIVPVYKTEMIPGYDIHDADYIDVFVGLKIIYEI